MQVVINSIVSEFMGTFTNVDKKEIIIIVSLIQMVTLCCLWHYCVYRQIHLCTCCFIYYYPYNLNSFIVLAVLLIFSICVCVCV